VCLGPNTSNLKGASENSGDKIYFFHFLLLTKIVLKITNCSIVDFTIFTTL